MNIDRPVHWCGQESLGQVLSIGGRDAKVGFHLVRQMIQKSLFIRLFGAQYRQSQIFGYLSDRTRF
eukprot:scaffold286_cov169-Amphora_coffeaeformis.AAC.3